MDEWKNYVLVEDSKYGIFYHRADSPEKLDAACVKILKDRYEHGWYSEPDENITIPYTEEEIENLPEKFAKQARREVQLKEEANRQNDGYIEWYGFMKDVVEAGQSLTWRENAKNRIPQSYDLLYARKEYEYEDVHLEVMLDSATPMQIGKY